MVFAIVFIIILIAFIVIPFWDELKGLFKDWHNILPGTSQLIQEQIDSDTAELVVEPEGVVASATGMLEVTGDDSCEGTLYCGDLEFPREKCIGGFQFTRRAVDRSKITKSVYHIQYRYDLPADTSKDAFIKYNDKFCKALSEKYGIIKEECRYNSNLSYGVENIYGGNPKYEGISVNLSTFYYTQCREITLHYFIHPERRDDEINGIIDSFKINDNEI